LHLHINLTYAAVLKTQLQTVAEETLAEKKCDFPKVEPVQLLFSLEADSEGAERV
jgi:hypothetical protein